MKRRIMAILLVLALIMNSNMTVVAGRAAMGDGDEKDTIKVVSVSLGDTHTAAITESGDLYCWGNNSHGQVMEDDGSSYMVPPRTPRKILSNVASVSLGERHSTAITTDGDLYSWGSNGFGQAGIDSDQYKTAPSKILSNVASVSARGCHSAAITTDGDLYCWGENYHGEIGNGSTDDQYTPTKILSDVASVSYGDTHTAAITTSGDLYCWGGNSYGQVGNGSTDNQYTPTKILSDVVSVSLGFNYSAAITTSGDLYCWGDNSFGKVGGSTPLYISTPAKILSNVVSVSLGFNHTAAITTSGDLYCWGENWGGKVGNGSTSTQYTPAKILSNIAAVSLGDNHSVAITTSGDLYCWGYNGDGQVGNGSRDAQYTPAKILSNVVSVSLGNGHTAAIAESGDLYCWGENSYGQVGNGTTDDQLIPIKILGIGIDINGGDDSGDSGNDTEDDGDTDLPDDDVPENAKSFYYASGSADYTSYFFYDDAYFDTSAYEYQSKLATMSMCMAFSAFGSNRTDDYTKKSQNLKSLLKKCEFPEENFDTNEGFTIKPQKDTIGVGASYKTITDKDGQDYTLIAVGVRGGGYESEWASNFTLGESGTHKGFTNARDQVLDFLKEYISNHNISGNVKIWIAGYSRAAATTNMVAGSLDDGYSLGAEIVLEPKDIYAYCFESPKGAMKSDNIHQSLYGNIFSIINPVDVVTKVAPTLPYDFSRYGATKYLPTILNDVNDADNAKYQNKKNRMLQYYNGLESTDGYIVDDFQMKKISVKNLVWDAAGFLKEGLVVNDTDSTWNQEAFLDEAVVSLFSEIGSRQNYVEQYEDDIREICFVLNNLSGDKWTEFQSNFIDKLKDDAAMIAAFIIAPNGGVMTKVMADDMVQALKDTGITDYSISDVNVAAGKLAVLAQEIFASYPNFVATAVCNHKGIGAAHNPELCLAWLMSFDPNYSDTNVDGFVPGGYRRLFINCPVDVEVYDKNNHLVATISNDMVDDGNELVCYINEAGEKMVYLPFSGDYTVKITATDDGEMDFSINEYSEDFGGINRAINYYNLPLSKGKSYTSQIPSVSLEEVEKGNENGTDAAYNIVNDSGETIESDIEMKGSEVADSTCTVEVTSNDTAYGNVIGNGSVIVGGYKQVTAIPNEGYRFKGWYSNNKLVSTGAEYRFQVMQDTKLIAQFVLDDTVKPDHSKPSPTPDNITNDDITGNTNNNNTTNDNTDNNTENNTQRKKTKNYATKINLKNKKTYPKSKKVKISDKNGIKTVKLNKKLIKVKGRKSFSFKLSKYKKYLKKKGKWNRLIVTDTKKKTKTIKFKTK